jgi:hypothetical protein
MPTATKAYNKHAPPPKSSRMNQHLLQNKRRRGGLNRRADVALIVILISLSAISITYCIHSTFKLLDLQNYHIHMDHLLTNHGPHSPVAPEQLAMERRWQRTVKSCLPTLSPKKCGIESEYYNHGAGSPANAHRVALIAPPGDFSKWIFTWISDVITKANGVSSTTHMHIELLTHVPPYSHGFAKVIRILPQSLLLGASDSLRGILTLGKTQQVLRFDDLKAALRLLLRYHCRISQMASHTPVFTLEMSTVSNTPRVASAGLLNFLNITAWDHGERDREELELEDFENSEDTAGYHMATPEEIELRDMGTSLEAFASSLLTWIQKVEHVHLKKELNLILEQELDISDDFSQCLSFWTVGEGDKGLDMSVFSRALATALVPDCASEKCTHPRDFCEEKGDAACYEKPGFPIMKANGIQLRAEQQVEGGDGGFVKPKRAHTRGFSQPGLSLLEEEHVKAGGAPATKTSGGKTAPNLKLHNTRIKGDVRQNNMKWSSWGA